MRPLFTALAIAALGLAFGAQAQQDFSKVEIKAEKLNDTTWMLTGAGGNIGLSVGEDAVFGAICFGEDRRRSLVKCGWINGLNTDKPAFK